MTTEASTELYDVVGRSGNLATAVSLEDAEALAGVSGGNVVPHRSGDLTSKAQALRAAADLVSTHGTPMGYRDLVDLVAVAYLKGGLDTRLEINEELRAAIGDTSSVWRDGVRIDMEGNPLTDEVAAHILRDMDSTPL